MKPIRASSALLVVPFLAATSLIACGAGAQDPPPADARAADAPSGAAPARAVAAAGETYVVTIASGPFAGTHRGAAEMNCMIHDDSWAADFTEERSRGVSALMVQLEGLSEAGGATDDVHLLLMFGQPGEAGGGGVALGGASGGTVRGTATREGADAVMRIEGTTAAGAAVSAMVRCGSEG